jgi:hypothetical protein
MNSIRTALTPALRTLVTLGLLVGAADAALAADSGSTDIFRNEFASSFGNAMPDLDASAQSRDTIGSTNIYVNQFERAFGEAATVDHQASNTRWNGSTDLWGDGFHESFEGNRSTVASDTALKPAIKR